MQLRRPWNAPAPRRARRFAFIGGLLRPHVPALVVFVLAFALSMGVLVDRGARVQQRFDFLHWELTSVANKWLWIAGSPLRDDPPADEAIARYFALEYRPGGTGRALENRVEAAIEGRIDAVLHELGVRGPVAVGPVSVFPPVDIELATSPRVVVLSPRSEIRRLDDTLLRVEMSVEDALEFEREIEANDPEVSAIVVRSGGVALYPAVVNNNSSYASTLRTAAHEWTHHYLAFYPVGRDYFRSQDMRTINETIADIVGDEVGALVLARFGDATASDEPGPQQVAVVPGPRVDTQGVLHDLRLQVDELLALGDVERAEALMEQVRADLWEAGVFIRRINQAYFAWYGTYAARPAAADPLGGQIREIRERAGSLAQFLTLIREVQSRTEVEQLLERLRQDEAFLAAR